jgi:hypothetical protein
MSLWSAAGSIRNLARCFVSGQEEDFNQVGLDVDSLTDLGQPKRAPPQCQNLVAVSQYLGS